MSEFSEKIIKKFKGLGRGPEVMGYMLEAKEHGLRKENIRPKEEFNEIYQTTSALKGLIFMIPVGALCWWLVWKLLFS